MSQYSFTPSPEIDPRIRVFFDRVSVFTNTSLLSILEQTHNLSQVQSSTALPSIEPTSFTATTEDVQALLNEYGFDQTASNSTTAAHDTNASKNETTATNQDVNAAAKKLAQDARADIDSAYRNISGTLSDA